MKYERKEIRHAKIPCQDYFWMLNFHLVTNYDNRTNEILNDDKIIFISECFITM